MELENQKYKIKKNPSIFIANEFFDAIAIKQFNKKKSLWFEKFVNLENSKRPFFFEKRADIKKIEKKIKYMVQMIDRATVIPPIV